MPKLSVIMSVYNQEDYLRESIDSILNQTFKDFEFLIINDGSTDSSLRIIESYRDHRIRIINNEVNRGLVHSLNLGLDYSHNSKFIARMDSDDIALANRFKEQVLAMESDTDLGLLGTGVKYFGSGTSEFLKFPPTKHKELVSNLLCQNPFYHPTVIMKAEVLYNNNIRYSKEYPRYDDYCMWIDIFDKCKIGNLQKIHLKYRRHSTNEGLINEKKYTLDSLIFKRLISKLCQKTEILLCSEELTILSTITSRSRSKNNENILYSDIIDLIESIMSKASPEFMSLSYLRYKLFERALLYFIVCKRKSDSIRLMANGNLLNSSKLLYSYFSRRD